MQDFKFNKKWLSQFAGRIIGSPKIEIAKRQFTTNQIPGRSKESYIDYGYYSNVEFERQIGLLSVIYGNTSDKLIESIIEWLTNSTGYCEFKDTQHRGMHTTAYLINISDVVRELRTYSTATLKFSREAFWFSDDGKVELRYSAQEAQNGINLINPYKFTALPTIEIELSSSAHASFEILFNNQLQEFILNTTDKSERKVIIDFSKSLMFVDDINKKKYLDFDFEEVRGLENNNIITVKSNSDYTTINSVSIKPCWRRL